MAEGFVFPPVSVWFDTDAYWLSDGFHRLAAAEKLGRTHFRASIRPGTLLDAQWHSYVANSGHGLRRTSADTRNIIQRALRHPKAGTMSTLEISRYLAIPEAPVRRWRNRLSSSSDEDGIRIVARGTSRYAIRTEKIGRRSGRWRAKPAKELRDGLTMMKATASPKTRRLIAIFSNWAIGAATPGDCVAALEQVISEWPPETAPEPRCHVATPAAGSI